MVLTLYLLRHAKAEDGPPSQTDFSRALAPRGRTAARAMARFLSEHDPKLDLVISSPAKRTRQTLTGIRGALGKTRVKFVRDLYLASEADLFAFVRSLPPDINRAMLIGHNPGFHELAIALSGSVKSGATRARMRMIEKFPTGALCEISFKGKSWDTLERGAGTLCAFIRPADLPSAPATS
jgi:phosphohistidine phosphatase